MTIMVAVGVATGSACRTRLRRGGRSAFVACTGGVEIAFGIHRKRGDLLLRSAVEHEAFTLLE